MKKLLALFIVFSFLIAGCGQEQARKKDANDQPEVTDESNQVDDKPYNNEVYDVFSYHSVSLEFTKT